MVGTSSHSAADCKTLRTLLCILALSCWSIEVGAAVKQGMSLELRVTTDRLQYRLDDEIRIEVKLVNTGRNPFYVLGILSWGYGGNLLLTMADNEGRKVSTEFPEHGGILPSMAGDTRRVLRLEPDHFFGTWRVNDLRYFVQKPGRYKVAVEYVLMLSAQDFEVEPFWGEEEGTIESFTFIDVVSP